MAATRYLIVTADDYGIGPETSRGILEAAQEGTITATVLLVNSPYAEASVRAWRQAGQPVELGWHPCLTIDRPVLRRSEVASLVGADGRFWRLGAFLSRLVRGQIHAAEVEVELAAQYRRFERLVGRPPQVINSHHHVQVFRPIGAILMRILEKQRPLPYIRRVREPWGTLWKVPGARIKRLMLSSLGRRTARQQQHAGFPGSEWLAGITDPPWVADRSYLSRWLTALPGRVVELTCHPGYRDRSLVGRDCTEHDGQLERRVHELALLRQKSFVDSCRRAGFQLLAPSELTGERLQGSADAA